MRLIPSLLRSLQTEKYTEPTPIQCDAIPHLLAGRDLLGCAQTGSGKTAAFALPILQTLSERSALAPSWTPRALVLAPTRELALQICDSFRTYGRHLPLVSAAVYGGVGQDRQVRDLKRGVDILIATPGRLLDLVGQGYVRLQQAEVLVLDEADRMLDMGFINDVRKIIRELRSRRQTMLFSATMPREIMSLADAILKDPVRVTVERVEATSPKIEESVVFVERQLKGASLRDLLERPEVDRALIFTRTKHGADRLVRELSRYEITADALHGNKSQGVRQRTLDRFRAGKTRFLVATDIAARGIDVEGITHVVNYDLPVEAEAYVHRIGRTARAGASGIAVSYCSWEEIDALKSIERLIGRRLPVVGPDGKPTTPSQSPLAAAAAVADRGGAPKKSFAFRGRPRRATARRRTAW